MSVKVKVLKERLKPASKNIHNELNDTKDVRIGYSRGDLDLSNDTRLWLVNAHQTRS